MLKNNFNIYSNIILGLFVGMIVWWLSINFRGLENTTENFYYGACLGLLPIIGSIVGFINAKNWGGFSSALGKASLFLSAGLTTWGVGTLIFAYYNFAEIAEVPYPSWADLAYIVSWPLWAIGMVNLSKATGIKFQLRKMSGKLIMFVIPVVIALISYYLLIVVARGGLIDFSQDYLKIFFDLAYPIGDVVILTISLLIFGLSFNYLGGIFKWPIILILLAFVFNYFADFGFSYTTTKETFFVANWVDLLFTTTFFCLGYGVSLMNPKKLSGVTTNQTSV